MVTITPIERSKWCRDEGGGVVARMLGAIFAVEAAMAVILFGTAGRWDLPWFWAVLAIHSALMIVAVALIDPDLRKERLRPGQEGAPVRPSADPGPPDRRRARCRAI